ncbi:MAG: inositol monophosphatase [Candidatus Aegiribacteria sp.]|nr:inositol monophosphatase [Candidatus Aegiribacteria sp.]
MINEIERAAREAGAILLEAASTGIRVSRKENYELVTTADLMSEEFLKKRLAEIEPSAGFLGEESWNGEYPDPPFWVVDPLDGTNNYAHGYPVFAVSIAFWNGSSIEAGCIYDPSRNESFSAVIGQGAKLNDSAISTTDTDRLSGCILATGFPYHRKSDDLGVNLEILKYFLGRVQGIRRGGSAALDLAYVAAGRLDGFWEEHLKPWDIAAGALIVREAGGEISSFSGEEWNIFSKGIVASGKSIHPEIRNGINQTV